jgi:hypothetical protein
MTLFLCIKILIVFNINMDIFLLHPLNDKLYLYYWSYYYYYYCLN